MWCYCRLGYVAGESRRNRGGQVRAMAAALVEHDDVAVQAPPINTGEGTAVSLDIQRNEGGGRELLTGKGGFGRRIESLGGRGQDRGCGAIRSSRLP
jgi:hypothetical protein